MGTLANSEDPDEMQHIAAFHQGLHCLLKLKQPKLPSGTEIHDNSANLPVTLKCAQWAVPNLLYQYIWEIHQNTKG